LLAVGWYFPESLGGTETYVRGLASGLARGGVAVAIAAPTADVPRTYEHDGTPIYRYSSGALADDPFDPQRDPSPGWLEVLERFRPTTVDVHSLIPGLSLEHVASARQFGAQTIVTVHVPEVLCARGTLMRFGTTPCDGDLQQRPCTSCRLEAAGRGLVARRLVASVPAALGERLREWPVPRRLSRSLGATAVDARRRRWLGALARETDRFVAPSEWLVAMLQRNGIASDRIVLCRQGADPAPGAAVRQPPDDRMLRVGFVGRYEPRKGLHVLIEAMRGLPSQLAIEVHVWGLATTAAQRTYRDAIKRQAADDPRVRFHEGADAGRCYALVDVLAVPSTGFETGPLVVLEAQAAGLPVIGSRLGGIAERVRHDVDGLLVPPNDPAALAVALRGLADDPARLQSLRPSPPRSLADVTEQTLNLYRGLAAGTAA
jgi:glycosyltransferase involved in cell wall biosynthesis